MKSKKNLVLGVALALATAFWVMAASAGSTPSNQIRDVKITHQGDKTTITVTGSSRPSFTAFRLKTPNRLVIDVADSQVRGVPSVIDQATKLINGVAVSEYSANGAPVSRIMVNFRKDSAYRVKAKGNKLVIVLSGSPMPVQNEKSSDVVKARAEAEQAKKLRMETQDELDRVRANSARQMSSMQTEFDRLKAESSKHVVEAKEAKVEAKKARRQLADQKTTMGANGRSAQAQIEKAKRQAEKYRTQVAKAESMAQAEQAKRENVEKRLSGLQSKLAVAEKEMRYAQSARTKVEADINRLKKTAEKSVQSALSAQREANDALNAQRKAAKKYDSATSSDRDNLRKILAQRERETVEARKKAATALQSRSRAQADLVTAKAELKNASKAAQKAKQGQLQLKRQTDNALAKADGERVRAQKAARLAQKRADDAREAQRKAELTVEQVRREAEAGMTKAQKAANARVLAAEERIAKAEQARKDTQQRLAKLEKELTKAQGTISSQEKALANAQRAPSSKKMTQEEKRMARMERLNGKKSVTKTKAKSTAGQPLIENIEFSTRGDRQVVIIKGNSPLEYNIATDANGNSTLSFSSVGLAPILERSLDVTDFGGVVGHVNSFTEGEAVKVEVKVDKMASNSIKRKGANIEWTFSGKNGLNTDGTVDPLGNKTRTIASEDAYAYPNERTAGYSGTGGGKKKVYTGRRIDLDFKDADIHNILRLLSEVGHVNVITADDVSGTVTIRMREVAWDHALDVILKAKHLGMVREGNLIRVAPLETLEKEREMEIAKRIQKQRLEPIETRLIPISYATAEELKPRAADMLTDRGRLSVDSRTNVIIARDTRGALNQIEALIRNLDTQTPQVLIEARIVEATSTYAREIGIQWGGDFSASAATANPTGLAFPSTIGLAGGGTDAQTPIAGLTPVANGQPNPNFAVNLPAAVGTGSGGALGITLGSIANNANLNLRLSAMEESGTLRILSSPKILTLDNREAHIEQGTSIPYSQISAQGIQTAFKDAKLSLTVTPHVTADGSILLSMKVMRDEPDFNNKGARGDPTILKREAETELLINDGHTAVIGGIFTRNHGTSYKKVPFFADIPVIGWLFKRRSDSDRRSEMLIFITPRIVNRAESIGQ